MSGTTVPADISGHMLDSDEDEDSEVFTKNTSSADGNPMPNSPDSMVNQFRSEEEPEAEQPDTSDKDIFVTVDKPESHITAVETFIMYRVVTKTTRSEFDSSEYEVRRRYQDFVWLKSRSEENYPTLIVHPLPEKFVMKSMVDRFNDDFIETRRRASQRFLNRISEHPISSYSHHFKVFLTEEESAPHRKQGPGFSSRMGDTMRAMAHSVRSSRNKSEEFAVMQEYVEDFATKMSSVDRVTQRIIREQREYMDESKQYSPTYSQWAESEEQSAEASKGVGGCVEGCSKETEEQIQHSSEVLVPVSHEYVICADTSKAVMRRRDNIQAEFEAKNEASASRKTDQEVQSQQEVEESADRVEQANNALRGDWERWRTRMRADLKSAFISTAAKNVDYYEKCLAVWESFLLSQRGGSVGQRNGGDAS